jgi:hypothetical protein
MATDTAQKQTETKPAEAPQATTPAASTTPAKSTTSANSAPSTQAKAKAKPRARSKSRAKTAAKSRTRSTASSSRSRTASKSRSRTASKSPQPAAARPVRTETTTAAPRAQAKAVNGGQQFVAGLIDAQEKTVTAIVDYQTRAAELSQIPGATAVAEVQAKVLRSVTDTYVSAARALLK